MSAWPNDYDCDPERFLSSGRYPHDDVHPYVAARLAKARARRVLDVGGGNGRLARLLPGLSMSCLLIDLSPAMLALAPRPAVRADGSRLPVADTCVDGGEDAAAIVTSVFSAPGDQVEAERWDGHLNTLSTAAHAAGFLRIHDMSDAEASAAASTLDLPVTLTMRGCIIYATKAP